MFTDEDEEMEEKKKNKKKSNSKKNGKEKNVNRIEFNRIKKGYKRLTYFTRDMTKRFCTLNYDNFYLCLCLLLL